MTSSWSAKAERGSTWLIQLIVWLARTCGRTVCRGLLYPITLYFVLTDRMARKASKEFLQRIEGQPVGWTQTFRHIYTFATTLLDRVYLAGGDFHRLDIEIVGREHLEHLLEGGKGCVVLGSHLGSFDLMMVMQRVVDKRPIHVMMRVDPRARVRRIAGIAEHELRIIQTGRPDSYLKAHQALEHGEVVAMLADRVEGDVPRLNSRFLGHEAPFPLAPHVLAARSGAPVIMCFGLYVRRNRYRIEFVEFGTAAACDARGVAFQPVVDRYAGVLEEYARRYPLNWFNFYPFWTLEGGRA
ncbi:hypothetical protein [Ottowia sp.]|jgi:predicted LPLAT superfamily acyltransferase|uniref:LpxL/LpxP family acyltransferase n=1 Tax=Ottowia sp. TaxID=1898956 RepID=UPI002BB2012F|nr:hypothetical protein [Ottowia sp.]HRN77126.1 hypothetical protein [Ottowia sp.]